MIRFLLVLSLTFSSLASAAEHQAVQLPDERMTVAVEPIGTDFVRFQVCLGGECKPLSGKTGIYHIEELRQRENDLIHGSAEGNAWIAKMKKRLAILGVFGASLALASHGTVMYLNSHGLMNTPAMYAMIVADAIGLTPVVLAIFYPYMIVPMEQRANRALARDLQRARTEDFDKESEARFRGHIEKVKRAVAGLGNISYCTASLTDADAKKDL